MTCRIASNGVYFFVVIAPPKGCVALLPPPLYVTRFRAERDAIGKQIGETWIQRVIVGVEQREGEERLATHEVCEVDGIGDQRDLPKSTVSGQILLMLRNRSGPTASEEIPSSIESRL